MRLLGNGEDVDDALQDAFCRLWSRCPNIDDPGKAEGYAVTAVRNASIDMLRRRRVLFSQSLPSTGINSNEVFEYIEDNEAAEDAEGSDATFSRVNSVITDILSERDREILYRREMYGHAYDEIAEDLGLTPENVRAIVSRARRAVRDRFRQSSHL